MNRYIRFANKVSVVIFFCLMFYFHQALAQVVPQGISYQTVVRDPGGQLVANTTVAIKFLLRQGTINGAVVFSEVHTQATNEFGLLNLIFGGGTIDSTAFSSVNWANGPFFHETQLDISGTGSSFTSMGTDQLLSVPYALYAANAAEVDDADADPANEIQDLSSTTSGTNRTINISGGTGTTLSVADNDNSSSNELQDISLTGTNLSITSGSSIDLSGLQDGVNDADADPTNEIQDLSSTTSGTNRTINISGGTGTTLSVADNDNSSSNELQNLSSSTSGTNRTLSITNGTGTTISVADNDNNSSNEIQTLSKTGTTVSLSGGGGSFTDATNDADADNSNELNTSLTLSGSTLSIGDAGGTLSADLSTLADEPAFYSSVSQFDKLTCVTNNPANCQLNFTITETVLLQVYVSTFNSTFNNANGLLKLNGVQVQEIVANSHVINTFYMDVINPGSYNLQFESTATNNLNVEMRYALLPF